MAHYIYIQALAYYVDPSSTDSHVELGTRSYPFKAIDDAFRELYSLAVLGELSASIYLKAGSNLTIHSIQMPLVSLNSNIKVL